MELAREVPGNETYSREWGTLFWRIAEALGSPAIAEQERRSACGWPSLYGSWVPAVLVRRAIEDRCSVGNADFHITLKKVEWWLGHMGAGTYDHMSSASYRTKSFEKKRSFVGWGKAVDKTDTAGSNMVI